MSLRSVGDCGSSPQWRQGARALSLSVNEGWYIKVLKGRLYLTPICNVGFYIEKGGFLAAAAKDARQRIGQRRHDMAASLSII